MIENARRSDGPALVARRSGPTLLLWLDEPVQLVAQFALQHAEVAEELALDPRQFAEIESWRFQRAAHGYLQPPPLDLVGYGIAGKPRHRHRRFDHQFQRVVQTNRAVGPHRDVGKLQRQSLVI